MFTQQMEDHRIDRNEMDFKYMQIRFNLHLDNLN